MFPGDDISRLLPNNLKSFASDLKKYPLGYPEWFYGMPPAEIYQGDVIANSRTILLEEDARAAYRDGAVVVISSTCDCQPGRDDYLLLAPLYTVEERLEETALEGEARDSHFHSLKRNELTNIMFYPATEKMKDSWVDFSTVCSVSSDYFYSKELKVKDNRIASLSQKGHYFFLMKLACHFCRADDAANANRTKPDS
jgi:hypothetical protein